MGRTIEQVALQRGHQIAGRINEDNYTDLENLEPDDVDVVIEFSSPESAADNITYCLKRAGLSFAVLPDGSVTGQKLKRFAGRRKALFSTHRITALGSTCFFA